MENLTFAQLISIYSEIGMVALCALMFILVTIHMFRKSDKQNTKETQRVDGKDNLIQDTYKELLKSVQEQNDKLVEVMKENNKLMMDQFVHKITHHTITPEESAQQSAIDTELKEIIVRIRKETKARRSSLVKYHNGGRGVNGQPFLKMSMTHEDLIAGVTPLIGDFKEQFRNLLGYFVTTVDKEDFCYIENKDELKEKDASMYEFMSIKDINSILGVSIKDIAGYPVGFLCLEFKQSNTNIENIKNIIEEDVKELKILMNKKILSDT